MLQKELRSGCLGKRFVDNRDDMATTFGLRPSQLEGFTTVQREKVQLMLKEC